MKYTKEQVESTVKGKGYVWFEDTNNKGYDVNMLNTFWVDSQAYILMAGVIYAIAMIFKRGIEIQNENDSTI